eukprot:3025216-Amphidinium_carterae.1
MRRQFDDTCAGCGRSAPLVKSPRGVLLLWGRGAFLDGNVLLIEPLDGRISWNGASILEEFPSSFS